jgi:hypothetical protein
VPGGVIPTAAAGVSTDDVLHYLPPKSLPFNEEMSKKPGFSTGFLFFHQLFLTAQYLVLTHFFCSIILDFEKTASRMAGGNFVKILL